MTRGRGESTARPADEGRRPDAKQAKGQSQAQKRDRALVTRLPAAESSIQPCSPDSGSQLDRDLAFAATRFDDLVDLTTDWLWECDPEFRLTFVSERITDRLGYPVSHYLGRRFDELAEGVQLPPAVEAEGHAPAPFQDWTLELPAEYGELRRFLLQGLPVFDPVTNDYLGYRGTARDISGKIAEEAALRQALAAAEAANRAKSEFLANTSHELRTPLNAIIGFTEVMQLEKFGPLGNDRYRQYIGDVLDSARHLLTVINDILDVAKIEAGRLELDEGSVEPGQLAQQVLRLFADRAERVGISLSLDLAEGLPVLWIDERKVKQILLNLLSNAVKFTPRGGQVTLSASLVPGGAFVFAVTDNGIGIATEDLEAAMAPFGQVDSQLSRRFEGTGLGLPLSDALVRLHGGRLKLSSTLGEGTRVTVSLPASRCEGLPG